MRQSIAHTSLYPVAASVGFYPRKKCGVRFSIPTINPKNINAVRLGYSRSKTDDYVRWYGISAKPITRIVTSYVYISAKVASYAKIIMVYIFEFKITCKKRMAKREYNTLSLDREWEIKR